MSASADLKIFPVPPSLLPQVWPHALPYIERGAEISQLDPNQVLIDLGRGHAVLWGVFSGGKLLASCFTSVHVLEDGARFLMLYGLGGHSPRRWVGQFRQSIEKFAKIQGCKSVAFHGVRGWARLVPGYSATPVAADVWIYERALS